MLHLLIERAETGEDIGNSEPFDSARDAALCDGLADGSAQTACYEGVLNGEDIKTAPVFLYFIRNFSAIGWTAYRKM